MARVYVYVKNVSSILKANSARTSTTRLNLSSSGHGLGYGPYDSKFCHTIDDDDDGCFLACHTITVLVITTSQSTA
jgi:hypothetical protein